MEKLKLRVAADRRTNNAAGDPRPGKIRYSRESHIDAEKKRQSPPPSSAVDGGNPRRRIGSETDSVPPPVINLSNWLPGWSAKAKRRQSSQSTSPENQEAESLYRNPQTQKPIIDNSIQEPKPQKRKIDALQIEPMYGNHSNSSNSSFSEAKELKIVDRREKEGKLGKRSYYREFDDPNKYHKSVIKKEDFTVTKTCQINSKSENIIIKHKTKKKMMSSVEASTSETHKCGICSKAFSSHQALGGHMSMHNRLMKITPKPVVNELLKEGQGSDGVSGGSKILEDENAHQCKVCKKNFPTGQALGGHQRCHWINPSEINLGQVSTDDAAMVRLGGGGGGGGRKVVDLDLNLAPPMVDDEYDEGGV